MQLEQALAYLERGELLEGEGGTWVYGLRKKSEDMLKQCRCWLAQAYERQGKLWQAGEQYRALCAAMPPDEEALQHWMALLNLQGKPQKALKCYQDITADWEVQGFSHSPAIEQSALSLNKQPPRALLVPSQTIQIVSPPSIEQSSSDLFVLTDSDVSNRLATLCGFADWRRIKNHP